MDLKCSIYTWGLDQVEIVSGRVPCLLVWYLKQRLPEAKPNFQLTPSFEKRRRRKLVKSCAANYIGLNLEPLCPNKQILRWWNFGINKGLWLLSKVTQAVRRNHRDFLFKLTQAKLLDVVHKSVHM